MWFWKSSKAKENKEQPPAYSEPEQGFDTDVKRPAKLWSEILETNRNEEEVIRPIAIEKTVKLIIDAVTIYLKTNKVTKLPEVLFCSEKSHFLYRLKTEKCVVLQEESIYSFGMTDEFRDQLKEATGYSLRSYSTWDGVKIQFCNRIDKA